MIITTILAVSEKSSVKGVSRIIRKVVHQERTKEQRDVLDHWFSSNVTRVLPDFNAIKIQLIIVI